MSTPVAEAAVAAVQVPASSARSGLIPLVVGVTGHRDLRADDVPRLEATVRALLAQLRKSYPNTPLLLITPLAEGADRLVARVALEAGAQLVVPLPMARADYETDFPDTSVEFGQLYDHPRTVRRLELPVLHFPVAGEQTPPPETRRALQYALVGAYVARHSQVLIALWDGRDRESIGGTGQVVHFRRTGRFALDDGLDDALTGAPNPFGLPDTPLDPHDSGPVYQVITPRARHDAPDNSFAGQWLGTEPAPAEIRGENELPTALATSLQQIEAFNIDAIAIVASKRASVEASEAQLYAGAADAVPGGLAPLRQSFALADALANHFQRETFRVMRVLYWLAFLAVLSFQFYGHLFPADDARIAAFLAGYLAVLGLADLIYLYSRHRKSQSKFQDYRAVAEGLRVQFYWRLAGLAHSGSDYYLRKQKDELTWIREAIRAWSVRTAPVDPSEVQALSTRWIQSQRDYFERAARREGERLAKYRSVAGGVILGSLLWAVPTVAVNLRALPQAHSNWHNALQLPLLVTSLVLAWHIAFKGKMMLRETHGRSTRKFLVESRTFVFSAALGIAFMLLMQRMPEWAATRWSFLPTERHAWIVVALGIITVVGALVHSYTDKRAFGEHAHQYARMGEIFNRAGERMTSLLHDNRLARARGLAIELGKEALAEHGDWVMLHRERPIELPKPEL